jgi:GDP-D-mannose dehydratase
MTGITGQDGSYLAELLLRRMGKAGREKALQQFTLERMLLETEAVYEEVLNSR